MNKFDKVYSRRGNKTRKWDEKLIEEKYGISSKNVIPMDIADMDFEVSEAIKNSVLDVALRGDYNYSYVYDETYESIINWNKRRFNITLKKEWIKICFGTCSVLHYIIQCFTKENDTVLINTPCYDPFVRATINSGAKPILNELILKDNKYYFDFEKIEKDIVENKVKIYILCSPQNPSGRIWTKEELKKILKLCNKYNVLLVSDEIHRDILRKEEKFTSIYNFEDNLIENTILCLSPNKAFNLGGLKGSYIVIKNKEIREKMLKYLERVYVTSPHVFMQPAFIAAYNKSEKWLDELSNYLEENFNIFEEFINKNIPEIEVMHAQSSFLVWINFSKVFKNEKEIDQFFRKIKVTYVSASYFHLENSTWVRLNLACRRELMMEVLNRMNNYIKNIY